MAANQSESTGFLHGEKPQHTEQANNNRRRETTGKSRLITAFFISILLLSLLFAGPRQCYRHIAGKLSSSSGTQTIDERVANILKETPLIDGHNDLAILIRYAYRNQIYNKSFSKVFEEGGAPGHVDIPRLRKGLNGGFFWSVYWECPHNNTDFSDEIYAPIVQDTLHQIDMVTRLKEAYPGTFSPTVNSSTALAAFKKGQLISPLGIEGLHQIGNSATNLRSYYALGVRYATLTHNCPNKYADSAIWGGPTRKAPSYWGGVSPEGRKLIKEMNRIGMIVDLSHTSDETQIDVLGGSEGEWEGSKAPVIYSHSSAWSLCPHPRNVKDSVLRLVKARNSLVMVNFAPDFVSCTASDNGNGMPEFYPPNSTLEHVANHVMHIGNLIGFDHVGFGSDFDGIPSTPEGLDDVSKYPDLVAELLKRGVSDEDAAKIVGGNLLRVWRDVDAVALELQAKGEPPLEDDLPPLRLDEDFEQLMRRLPRGVTPGN